MTQIRTRAPGKLFLLGEYAVLDGAPAVVAAVDRYVNVELGAAAGACVSFTSDQTDAVLEFGTADPPADHPFYNVVLSAYRACLEHYPVLERFGFNLRIASASSYSERAKVGFGSSAAVSAAVVAALSAAASGSSAIDPASVFDLALGAHRRVQRGLGSGADVAASVFGSIVLLHPRPAQLPRVTPLPVPADLRLLAAWTGEPASSVDLIRGYQALGNGDAAGRREFVRSSTRATLDFAAAAERGEVAYAAIDASALAMEALAQQTHLPILTPELRRLIACARTHGAAAKVSGAGGGDCGIALVHDDAQAEALAAAWRAAGLVPLDVAISPQGVCVELS